MKTNLNNWRRNEDADLYVSSFIKRLLAKRLSRFLICMCILFSTNQVLAIDEIDVVTLNQYLGADLTPVLSADPGDFNAALVDVLQQAAASDFAARALEQARMIAKRSPEIIGLQEVWVLSCVDLAIPEPGSGCDDPSIANAFVDHLQLTLEALNQNGVDYIPAAIVKNLDLGKVTVPNLPLSGIPFNINGSDAMLIATDRDVILSRQDVEVTVVDWSVYKTGGLCIKPSMDGCNYQIVASADTPVGPLAIERGFVAVDAKIRGKGYRIVNTHLEVKGEDIGLPEFTYFQAAQAYELLETIYFTTPDDLSLIVLWDINSSPEQADITGITTIITPYHQFVDSGFYDVWELRPGKVPGYTCCQAEDLVSRQSLLTERIDMIFTWDMPEKAKQVRVLGDKVSTKTNPPGLGLWSTDHGGIAAVLQF